MQHTSKAAEQVYFSAPNVDSVKQSISLLQKTKNYKTLGQAAGLSVTHSHCGWGWRTADDASIADDLPYEAEAWEAGCFENGLMDDVESMEPEIIENILRTLGFIE